MSAIQVQGLLPLNGRIQVQGSKNGVLPLMAAALLGRGVTVLRHVPRISDVRIMADILRYLGCRVSLEKDCVTIDASALCRNQIPRTYAGKMRSSCLLLGPLLARLGEAVIAYPGGCVIGKRPIDFHIHALERLGAGFKEQNGWITAKAAAKSGRLFGTWIVFPYPSVGATENALLASVLAEGTTILLNCAMEPEIEELCRFLIKMGARIRGAGGPELVIEGKEQLEACEFDLQGDRICGGTYLAAAMTAGGDVTVSGVRPGDLREPLKAMRRMGARIQADEEKQEIRLVMEKRPEPVRLETGPYPMFPTDLQPLLLAAACTANGKSRIRETVFEARFEAAKEMRQFGAGIGIEKDTVFAEGRYPLRPAFVRAPDLRGGAALVLAALAAEGESRIADSGYIKRGYEDICRDLRMLGADVREIGSGDETAAEGKRYR